MPSTAPFLKAEKIWFRYTPSEWVLKDLSLDIKEGSLNMLMGASGSGKSTLLKVISGLQTHQQGSLFLFGQERLNGLSRAFRPRVGYIPQQLGLVRNLSVMENVLVGSLSRCKGLASLLGFFPKEEIKLAHSFLQQLRIDHKAESKVFHLSGGERQRVAIARTLMQKPELILADELVSELDIKTATEILELVHDICHLQGVTFLMSMHELQLVKAIEGNVFIMKEGRLARQCSGREVEAVFLEEMLQ